jgi:hypothetical protein
MQVAHQLEEHVVHDVLLAACQARQ